MREAFEVETDDEALSRISRVNDITSNDDAVSGAERTSSSETTTVAATSENLIAVTWID